MGEVYRATDETLKRDVAIKLLLADSDIAKNVEKRFLFEAQAISALKHPNIVRIHDIGQAGSRTFIVMEFIEGVTLDRHIAEKGKIGPRKAKAMAREIAKAIAFAHRKKVIHRDIKPRNIIVTPRGDIKLLDFGLARPETESGLTETGRPLGTPDYMSPEQRAGAKDVDRRTDIYSFGATLYEMLTGSPPRTIRESEIPVEFRSAILTAMSNEPENRHQSIKDMFAEIEAGFEKSAPPEPKKPMLGAAVAVPPKKIIVRILIALAIIAAVALPVYWFGLRGYMLKKNVKSLLHLYLDPEKPDADRRKARDKLIEMGPKAVPTLVRELEDNADLTYGRKGKIAGILADIGDSRAVEGMIRSVVDDKKHSESMKRTGYYSKMMAAADKAEAVLEGFDRYTDAVAKTLGVINHPKTVSYVRKHLDSDDIYLRLFTIRVMAQMKRKKDTRPLLEIMKDKGDDLKARAEAAAAIGLIGHHSAVRPLIAALAYEGDVQLQAVISLSRLRDRSAVKPLMELFNQPKYSAPLGLDETIVATLGRIGGTAAKAHLWQIYQRAEEEGNSELQRAAHDAILRIDKPQLPDT